MYSSDMGRAFITAYYISRGIGYTGEIVTQSGLREVSYGDAGNMFSKDAYKLYPELDRITDFSPPNGESLDQMQQRVLRTVAEIDQFNTDKTILLVAHSGVMAALEAAHLGRDFGQQNISEAYDHDVICQFTVTNEQIATFEKT